MILLTNQWIMKTPVIISNFLIVVGVLRQFVATGAVIIWRAVGPPFGRLAFAIIEKTLRVSANPLNSRKVYDILAQNQSSPKDRRSRLPNSVNRQMRIHAPGCVNHS